jgi:uncharacterized protein
MKCPICDVDLQLAERQGVEIDYCPKCRGVWLDRGELDKIIERGAAELQPTQPAPGQGYQNTGYYDKHHDSHHGDSHHYKRRKSFLEQLFD